MVQAVYLIVARGDGSSLVLVDVDESHDHVSNLPSRQGGHRREFVVRDHARDAGQLAGLFRHRSGVVADPLELVRDAVEGEQEAQVSGDWCLGCDRQAHDSGNGPLDLVDASVGGDDLLRQARVSVEQGVVGGHDLFLDVAAHAQDAFLDVAHLVVEALANVSGVVAVCGGCRFVEGRHGRLLMFSLAHPNRPEM